MRFEFYLKEEYYGRVSSTAIGRGHMKSGTFEVFENPSWKEMMNADSEKKIRFIADAKKKKLYIWGYRNGFHDDVWDDLNTGRSLRSEMESLNIITGVAKKTGSMFEMYRSDAMSPPSEHDVEKLLKDFKWLKKYKFSADNWIKYNEDFLKKHDKGWE